MTPGSGLAKGHTLNSGPLPPNVSTNTSNLHSKWLQPSLQQTANSKLTQRDRARARQMYDRSLGNGVHKNGVRNRCPYRRCGVDTEIPCRLFSLILCSSESLEAEFTRWFGGIEAVDTEFLYRVPIVERGRLPYPCLPTPFPILRCEQGKHRLPE